MRTHMDVQEGYRPFVVTVKASGAPAAPDGQIAGPPEAGPVERYAPGMGYPGDEGGGPPDSRVDAPAGRRGDRREGTRPSAGPGRGIRVQRGDQLPGQVQRQPPAPGRCVLPRRGRSTGTARGSPDTSGSYPDTGSYPGIARSPDPTSPDSERLLPGPGCRARGPGTPGSDGVRAPRRRNRGPGAEPAGAGADQRRRQRSRARRRAAQPRPPRRPLGGGPPSRENAWRRPERRPGQEIQGGPGNSPASGAPQPRGSLWSAGAFRTAGPGGRGPVRGFPPAPGAPDPVYPPGQFSPWNASALRAASAAGRACLTAGPDPRARSPGTHSWP